MSLSADQQAMLQLLLERGQSYDDLGSLLDIGPADVRARARAALTDLGGVDPDRNVGLTDWILGQADPIGRADAVRHLKEDAADHALVAKLLEELRTVAPRADLPRLPGEPRGGFLRRGAAAPSPADAAPPAASPATQTAPAAGGKPAEGDAADADGRRTPLSHQQTRLLVILGSAGVILIAVVLAVAGAFSGGSDASSSADTTATSSGDTTTAQDQRVADVPLKPVDGGDARGLASIGIAGGSVPFVDITLRNLETPPTGQTYIVWFLFGSNQGYPLAPIQGISQTGSYSHRFQIPAAVVSLISRTQQIEVTLASDQTVARAIQQARKSNNLVIEVPGKPILLGTVPKAQPTGG